MDRFFFKKISRTQWLGLRLPGQLKVSAGPDGSVQVTDDPFTADAALPAWAANPRLLALQLGPGGPAAALVAAYGDPASWTPFRHSLGTLSAVVGAGAGDAGKLAQAMKAATDRFLPLRVYEAYRDVAVAPERNPLDDAALRKELLRAVGGSATLQPLEAFSELLFVVTVAAGQAVPAGPAIDPGDAAERVLRVLAYQSATGVTLQFEQAGERLANGNICTAILGQGVGVDGPAPFYRWQRTLGLGERPSAASGAVQIPAGPPIPVGDAAAARWAQRPFSLVDRLGPEQLAGELLNYEVQFCNAHGRTILRGRVMLKRQRLQAPAQPLRASAQLLRPEPGAPVQCTVAFDIAAGQPQRDELLAVIYRQDYPIVPTGFYGDADDAALTVARSLGDFGSGEAVGSQLTDDAAFGGEPLPNLSNHNLVPLAPVAIEALPGGGGEPGAPPAHVIRCNVTLTPGTATRLFLALRLRLEPGTALATGVAAPESPVALVQHMTGATPDTIRNVPHFERFWDPLPPQRWLPMGAARIMEVRSEPAKPSVVRIVVQHAGPGQELTGGYRLWLRDVAAPGEATPFRPVALVQAVPPLAKAYAPLEFGGLWRVGEVPERATSIEAAVLASAEFLVLTTPAAPGATAPEAAAAAAATGIEGAMSALQELAREAAAAGPSSAPGLVANRLLVALLRLREAGCAREVLLSVAKRQAMDRTSDQPDGNWVFFRDQHGMLLGRAFQFWLPRALTAAEAAPSKRYTLSEIGTAQDTLALDDFGRIAWSWTGLTDRWRHEIECLVEAVSRYAPIQEARADLAAYAQAMALAAAVPAQWPEALHRLVIARREPFDARLRLAQVLDTRDDAFVIALDASQEFRLALHNTVARTRQGVLRVHAAPAERKFRFENAYDGQEAPLLEAWLGPAGDPPSPRQPRMAFVAATAARTGTYGELVFDEPPCFTLRTAVGASADDMHAAVSPGIGPLERPRAVATPPAQEALVPRIRTQANDLHIDIELARLDWSYGGASRPLVGGFIPNLQQFADRPLLRLPDPEAEMLLLWQVDQEPLRLVGHFRGSAFANVAWPFRTGWNTLATVQWGAMQCWDALTAQLTDGLLRVSTPNTGTPARIVVRWRCAGMELAQAEWRS